MTSYDTIIIGAGHNGLVCAAYLAKAGQRVLVLEAADAPGGLAADREFHPGFHSPVAHSLSHFSGKVAADLNLAGHGFTPAASPLPLISLGSDTNVVIQNGDVSGASSDDATAYGNYDALLRRFAGVLDPFWHKTMPRIGNNSLGEVMTFAKVGLGLRRLGKEDMGEFLRVASLPIRDLVDEHFENEQLKALLCWDGLIGSKMAPRSPNSAVLALLYRMAGDSSGGHTIPAGGVTSLINALCKSAEDNGAEVRCSAEVARIMIDANAEGLAATGVHTMSGETIKADRVVSATDSQQTFINLVGVENLDIGFTNRIRRVRSGGLVGKLHLALNSMPEFRNVDRPDGRMIIAPEMDAIEFAFDDAKYGDCSADPVMEIAVPSAIDSTMAPDGKHVLSAHVMYIPHQLKGGWTEAARNEIHDRVIDAIAQYADGIQEQIVASEFLTPADIEHEYRVTGGHWHHGDFAMDQMLMMRPTYEAAQYDSPIPGLHLCSAACHPGGDLTGMAGHNAAQELLR
ncbi:MAG: phytoene desaturase family protein [Woeseiaceae bacterium]